jgi:hypothetical protein
MNKPQNQFTTARLKTKTKIRAEKAKLIFGFNTIESALDTFILFGIKSYRESIKKNNLIQENTN